MPGSVDDLLNSPRLKLYSDRIVDALRNEQAARAKFRDELTEDTRAEFINGKIVMHSPSRWEHNRVMFRIAKILDAFVGLHDLGSVGVERLLIGLTRNDVEPDVAFWKRETSATFEANQLIFPPPQLVVEVLSLSTERVDRGVKQDDYAAHNILEYWIVDSEQKTLEQYLLHGEAYELRLKSGSGQVASAAINGGVFNIEAFFDDRLARRELQFIME